LTIPLAVAIVALLGVPGDPPLPEIEEPDLGREMLAGLRMIVSLPDLRTLVGIQVVKMFVEAMLDVLVVVVAVSLLSMGEQGAGWLNASWGVGGVCGGAVATALLVRHRLPMALRWGMVLIGLPLVAIALWPHVPVALSGLLVVGIALGLIEVALLTLSQRLV